MDAFGIEEHLRFGPADDDLHPVGDGALDWTETLWWSFNVAERDLGGWLYTQIRPNLGTVAGGAMVYDPSAHLPWELPYFAYQHHQPVPEPLDLHDVTFRTGVSSRVREAGLAYELGYRFRDQDDFVAELHFEGLTPPVPHRRGAPPFVGSSHYDQHGHVTGQLWLRGEEIAVDCVAVRDRSWGRRPEHLGRGGRLSYAFGHLDSGESFLAFCTPPAEDQLDLTEQVVSGYLLRDGVLRRVTAGTRRVTRDDATGGVASIQLDATDVDGRHLSVAGVARSRMFLFTGQLCINTIMRWTSSEGSGIGEDQDVWSTAAFADLRGERRAPR